MAVINSEALKVVANINKKLGAGTVVTADKVRLAERITTGSLTLDVVLGGGWPMNHWVELVGEASHGKTALALKTIGANQKLNPEFTAVWIAAEAFDAKYAELCGVDTQRVILVETNSMEDAFDAVIQFMESKAVDMVVVDSLPALVPSAEDEKHMEEFTVGRGALITNKFFRKVASATKRDLVEAERPVLGIMINQYRMKIGVMHGDPRTTPGGLGKDYAYSIRAEVKRDDWLEVGTGQDKRRVGGGPIDAGGFDTGKEIVALSILNGIVDRRGGWMYYGERKWQGAQALIDSLREEVELRDEISRAVMDTLKSSPVLMIEANDEE